MVSEAKTRNAWGEARLKIMSDMIQNPETAYQTAISDRTGLRQGYVSQELERLLTRKWIRVTSPRKGWVGRGRIELYQITDRGICHYITEKPTWNRHTLAKLAFH